MSLIAIPNVSEGKDPEVIQVLTNAVASSGARILDVHSDPVHNRSVMTIAGEPALLGTAMVALARSAADHIDLRSHTGVHPRLGALDVCPFVPAGQDLSVPVAVAHATARAIGSASIPVYLYGAAARRPETSDLPRLRAGGLGRLIERIEEMPPDEGPVVVDPQIGVVCVGARLPLIAFNVWLEAPEETARAIAARIRTSGDGRPGIRALGLKMDIDTSQVSMNLTDPATTGIDDAYEAVKRVARKLGCRVISTEIVGLPPERFMPDPQREAARLLISPGRSLESVLTRS